MIERISVTQTFTITMKVDMDVPQNGTENENWQQRVKKEELAAKHMRIRVSQFVADIGRPDSDYDLPTIYAVWQSDEPFVMRQRWDAPRGREDVTLLPHIDFRDGGFTCTCPLFQETRACPHVRRAQIFWERIRRRQEAGEETMPIISYEDGFWTCSCTSELEATCQHIRLVKAFWRTATGEEELP